MIRHSALRIEARFLDSFMYSGALFLLDMNGTLTSYDWHRLVEQTLAKHGRAHLESLFLDSRQAVSLEEEDHGLQLEVSTQILRDAATSEIRWRVWPTDLNVFANKIYISDESGAYVSSYDYASKLMAQDEARTIKSGYVYSVAPGDGGRLAIASATGGLSVLFSNGQERALVEDDVYDCDWFGTKLVANSRNHSYLTTFPALPKRESFKDIRDFFSSMKLVKTAEPTTETLDLGVPHEYHWLAGEDVVDEMGQDSAVAPDRSRIIKARSASFGSIVEHLHGLVVQRSDQRERLEIGRPIFWRTFSRSKSYLNHLHACDSEGMQIRAYDTRHREPDRYSVELADFEL